MKTNLLKFKRVLNATLVVLLLSVVGMTNAFAQMQVATLQHGEEMSAFYGPSALIEANNAAEDGDIITLSSGTFQSCDIYRSIIIHGAGCVYDSITQVMPTIITGDLILRQDNILIEGINSTGSVKSNDHHNIILKKCSINAISHDFPVWGSVYNNRNWQIVNCIIKQFAFYAYHIAAGNESQGCFSGMSIINSVVRFTNYNHLDIYNATTINNSVVLFDTELTINNIMAYNSIITTISGHEVSNCAFYNCIGIEMGETSLFEGQTVSNVMEANSYEDVFETFTGEVTYDNIYQLKEDIAPSFLGNDGSQVGIYGGMMPYNPRPGYLILNRCNVAGQSTIDGKLSVDIEIINGDN